MDGASTRGTIRPTASQSETRITTTERFVDVVFGTGLLLFTLPVTVSAAVALKLSQKGPLFDHEDRVALNGQSFKALRFHCQDGDHPSAVGSIMIKTRIDEIPQVLNVIRGEMSFFTQNSTRPFMA